MARHWPIGVGSLESSKPNYYSNYSNIVRIAKMGCVGPVVRPRD